MAYIDVVLNVPLNGSFTYKADCPVEVGLRVEVYFGTRTKKMTGFIIKVHDDDFKPNYDERKIKEIIRIIDKEPLFTIQQVNLAKWISSYYLCSEGEALSAMIPSGKRGTEFSFGFEDDSSSYKPHQLSEEQENAANAIIKTDDNKFFHYLFGQTGSGKTEVFLTAAEKMLSQGKGVIYLVPEISLTHQVIETVSARFGKTVAVLHSGLTASQKLTEWKRILKKEARVVIGARSAVFAPVPDLGLIIIDEEHDSSYKSGNTPRYHGRQVAMKRCLDLKIPLVMGSATPSVEAYELMNRGTLVKHTLSKRLSGGKPPAIEVVNLGKPETKKASNSISEKLYQEILQAKQEGRQSILFLNRRGFSHFFKCNTCGEDLKCKNCSVSLTYHKSENRLKCHYCGWSVYPPRACPKCNSLDVGYSGFGTEFIEEEVRSLFPDFTVDRIDTDNLTDKNALQQKIADFKAGKIDILLGTQMVAKGLNFPGLKLVGVIQADTGLTLPDFRAAERTFALILQVAGRAGRYFPDGKVIVQSFNPHHQAISCACKNDIEGFYSSEIENRKILYFPPFSRMLRIVFRSANEVASKTSAQSFAKHLEAYNQNGDFEILGPSECALKKIALNYRYQILLRGESINTLQKIVSMVMCNYKTASNVYIEIDIDPTSLL